MAEHNAFELVVLGFVADDYEAPHTIAGDIAHDLQRPIAEAEVLAALLSLARIGLVQSYVFEPGDSGFRAVSAKEAASAHDPWFMATAAGKTAHESHAN